MPYLKPVLARWFERMLSDMRFEGGDRSPAPRPTSDYRRWPVFSSPQGIPCRSILKFDSCGASTTFSPKLRRE